MTRTITLDDVLVGQLQQHAAAQQLSLEAFAVQLLREAVAQRVETTRWAQGNQRRLALIRQSVMTPLSREEAAELEALQATLDQRLTPMDDQLLAGLAGMQEAVEALPDEASP